MAVTTPSDTAPPARAAPAPPSALDPSSPGSFPSAGPDAPHNAPFPAWGPSSPRPFPTPHLLDGTPCVSALSPALDPTPPRSFPRAGPHAPSPVRDPHHVPPAEERVASSSAHNRPKPGYAASPGSRAQACACAQGGGGGGAQVGVGQSIVSRKATKGSRSPSLTYSLLGQAERRSQTDAARASWRMRALRSALWRRPDWGAGARMRDGRRARVGRCRGGWRRAMGRPALLLLALCAAGARGLYFHIGETEKRCFIEEIPDETMVIGQAGRGRTGPCVSPRRGNGAPRSVGAGRSRRVVTAVSAPQGTTAPRCGTSRRRFSCPRPPA